MLSGRQMKSLSLKEKLDFSVLEFNLYGTDPSHWVRMCCCCWRDRMTVQTLSDLYSLFVVIMHLILLASS